MRRALAAPLLLLLCSACNRSAPAGVAATVNGRAITFAELDKQYQYSQFGQSEHPSDDQLAIQRLEVLRTLLKTEHLKPQLMLSLSAHQNGRCTEFRLCNPTHMGWRLYSVEGLEIRDSIN